MLIHLQKRIQTKSYIIKAEIQKLEKREELIAILKLAQNHGNQVTPELIVNELLANRPVKVGRRVIEWCQSLGLLDKYGGLTKEGKESLKDEMVFISEIGIYKITISDDPLIKEYFDRVILLKVSHEGNLKEDINEMKKLRRDFDFNDQLIDIPETVLSLAGTNIERYKAIGKDNADIKIKQIESKGEQSTRNYDDFTVEILLKQHENSGKIILKKRDVIRRSEKFNFSFENGLQKLLDIKYADWNPDSGFLHVTYPELNDESEKREFQKNISFNNPTWSGYGTFDPFSLKLPIQPKTADDAMNWFQWLLIDKIEYFLNSVEYHELAENLKQKFLEFELPIPDVETILSTLKNDPKSAFKYWFLQAPIDLQLKV